MPGAVLGRIGDVIANAMTGTCHHGVRVEPPVRVSGPSARRPLCKGRSVMESAFADGLKKTSLRDNNLA